MEEVAHHIAHWGWHLQAGGIASRHKMALTQGVTPDAY